MNAARMFRISCIWAIATVVLAIFISSEAPAQGRKSRDSDFAPGDRVEVRQGSKWQAGEFVETTRGGLVKVQAAGTPKGLVAAKPPGDWQTITALEGRVSIQLPGKATKAEQVSQSTQGPVTFVVYKYSARGRFWNFYVVTYPAEVIKAATDKIEFLKRIGSGMMRGKAGSEQIAFTTLKESAYPAIRLEYRYPPGKNSAGEYGGGQATHELYLIGNQVCWAFVDVLDVAREVEKDKVTAEIKNFFTSLVLPKDKVVDPAQPE